MKIIQIGVGANHAPLIGYLQDYVEDGGIKNIRPSIVICPGGAYRFLSWRERDHVAMRFLAEGYNVFILEYSVGQGAKDLNPLMEASDALVKIRLHATEWLCDPMRVAIMGFSAGGHVAASLALLSSSRRLMDLAPVEKGMNKPDACVLCYPVITTGPFCHQESIDNVTGGKEEDKAFFSLENQVGEDAPPFFIWHTGEDQAVPVENSLLLASALRRKRIPFALHIFQEGQHGLSTCDSEVNTPAREAHAWISLCLRWLSDRFDYSRD